MQVMKKNIEIKMFQKKKILKITEKLKFFLEELKGQPKF